MSLAIIFAQKDGYDVDANQELFALGMSNVVGSFFSCIPNVCALSRTSVQYQTGGKTQMASIFAALLMLVVLLWIGPCFEMLPRCVLAAVIFVALKPMLLKISDFKRFQNEGRLDATVWLITFVSVVVIDLDIGLLIGVAVSLIVLYLKGWKTYYQVLGTLPGSGIYLDLKSHSTVVEVPQTKIFKYIGPVNFANKSDYRSILYKEINVNAKLIRRASLGVEDKFAENASLQALQKLILDLSAIPHVDSSTCKMFNELQKDLNLLGISTFFTGPNDSVYDAMMKTGSIECVSFRVFPTVHDAVLYRIS
jgi:solute carrier family 26 protein